MRPGMTLLELVVGLAIVGMATSAGYAAFVTAADQRERAAEALAEARQDAAVRQLLVDWLRGARLTVEQAGPSFTGLDGTHDGWPDDELRFLTTVPAAPDAGEAIIRLYIDRDEATPERGLVADVAEWRGTTRRRVELAPAATGLGIRYLTGVSGATRWLPSWISTSVLPRGVELMVEAEAPDSLPTLLRRPVLVALAGAR